MTSSTTVPGPRASITTGPALAPDSTPILDPTSTSVSAHAQPTTGRWRRCPALHFLADRPLDGHRAHRHNDASGADDASGAADTVISGRIVEIPIPKRYGDEMCRVNGMRYAGQVSREVVRHRRRARPGFVRA